MERILRSRGLTPVLVTADRDAVASLLARASGVRQVVFDHAMLSYGEIIACMEAWSAPGRVRFHIYSPESGKIVSPHTLFS